MDDAKRMNFHSSILQVASMIKSNEQKKIEGNIDMEKKKRERQANYSQNETNRLVELVISKKDKIENKKSGADYWQEKKQAWDDIERDFNKSSSADATYRDSKTLRIKYECLKRDIRKKWANILAGRRNPNGKLPKLTSIEKKLKGIMQLPIEEELYDFSSMDDKSDEDAASRASSPYDTNSKDLEILELSVKKEPVQPDEKELTFETSTNIGVEFKQITEDEPPSKKIFVDSIGNINDSQKDDNIEEKLKKEKLKRIHLQNIHLKQEIKIQTLKMRIIEEELQHKKILHELEKRHIQLKIDALKNGHNIWNNEDNYSDDDDDDN